MPCFFNVFFHLFPKHVLLSCFWVFAHHVTKACIVSFFFFSLVLPCVSVVTAFLSALWWKSKILIVLPTLATVHDTVQYRYSVFSLLYHLLRNRLQRQNPLLSSVRDREKVHCKCTMQCTVHFIITLFNVGNVLLYVICQLNFTVFMHVTRISCYVKLYIAFGIIRGFT